MNFIKAIQHATIGYGIRRIEWRLNPNCWLSLDNFGDLQWCEANVAGPARLVPVDIDLAVDITAEDIRATDWETL